MIDTFVAPSRTFNDIFRSTAWWLPLLLLALAGAGLGYTIDRKVGFDRVTRNQIHAAPAQEDKLNQLEPDQKARVMQGSITRTRYLTYLSALPVLLFFALYALILWGSFNFGLGATTTYGQVYAVIFYAALPYLIRTIVTVLILVFGNDPDAFNLTSPVGSNPGYYMPDAAPWLRILLGRIDLFEIWVLVLTVLGMAIIARKTIAQSATVVVGLYVLATLLYVGLTAAFS